MSSASRYVFIVLCLLGNITIQESATIITSKQKLERHLALDNKMFLLELVFKSLGK